MEKHVKIYGDYGYEGECLLHECNTVQEAQRWVQGYLRDGMGGYSVIEAATFAEDGEYVVQFAQHADDMEPDDDYGPDEAQEWHDYDPDC
jgi:hypothetical protein